MGIELRGGSSQSHPKKTYDLELWTDEHGTDVVRAHLGHLRNDDDWILDGMYNEPLRIRSFLSHNLWLDMHEPHYRHLAPSAKAGAGVVYVEAFLNGQYNGVYLLSEQVDKKQLQIQDYDGSIRGELYKAYFWGAPTLMSLPDYSNDDRQWKGWEIKYPEDQQVTEWENLYKFSEFVIESDDLQFETEIWDRFDKSNCMDYFIFLNLIRASDNTGKNTYLGKFDVGHPYFYVPWDLDGTWGTEWRGLNHPSTDDVLSNGLFSRLIALNPNGFVEELSERWNDYREDILSHDRLISQIYNAYYYLKDNGVYQRESVVYDNYDYGPSALYYTLDWLEDRLIFLDRYFNSTITSTANDSESAQLIVYPNPADQWISFTSDDNIESVGIYSIEGRLAKIVERRNGESIYVGDLQPGSYVLRTTDSVGKLYVVR